ncbi:hypothetical protein [Bradyrhizobium arachidis]|uniref:Uncharacterized protein n=1 Tax=Bradyrhizobium arachidis TaxID=858423 RepID=A0AAE7NPS9_9BRAD|nr:hypothetical protein [Bradyrhizobium arachidis]QOZ68867.1 hypothetical protein WN72_22975 [Bradyrhizobium arachidis]SFV19261.1 hypothetical protein SAMN05192541_1489 [Bradyrhizobium arachidis]
MSMIIATAITIMVLLIEYWPVTLFALCFAVYLWVEAPDRRAAREGHKRNLEASARVKREEAEHRARLSC